KRAHLYVGNLSPRVTEYMLQEIFAVAGPVLGVKIIPDRSMQHGGINYGFVEYHEMRSAETALQALNGRRIFDLEVRVNWAYQNTNTQKEDLSQHYHLFVGDLSPEVNDSVLQKAFSAFGSLSDARVMWDANTGKSRGYGFLAFRDRTDAEQAINAMNGEWLGARAIRVNWANQKNNQGVPQPGGGPGMSSSGGPPPTSVSGLFVEGLSSRKVDFCCWQLDAVINQAPAHNTTVYVGNLVPYATQADLAPLFQSIGHVFEIRLQADRGFAFVKYATHELAASAIVNLNGTMVHGRPLKLSWGKESGRNEPAPGGYAQHAPQPVA
ncbi:RNA-binding domain-containing protein, partial [Rhodotorula sp. JG-1b]